MQKPNSFMAQRTKKKINTNHQRSATINQLYLFLFLFPFTDLANGTCVLDSDFGFILNCNFKKSSLFRVRNLGGLKAHFGLGI